MVEMLRLKVVTPKGSQFNEDVLSFTARSELGEFCILPNHRPLLSTLIPGRMIAERQDGTTGLFALNGGFLEAGTDHVNVITETCVAQEKLDKGALTAELKDLEQKLDDTEIDTLERRELESEINWTRARIEVA
jgi:F-type H+-transporting ATPase subunit epsilon